MTQHSYQESSDLRWTEIAVDMLTKGTLAGRFRSTRGVGSAHVWGSCPRCGDTLDVRQTLTAVLAGERSGALNERYHAAEMNMIPVAVDIDCGCHVMHSGAPDGIAGCGISFRVELLPDIS